MFPVCENSTRSEYKNEILIQPEIISDFFNEKGKQVGFMFMSCLLVYKNFMY